MVMTVEDIARRLGARVSGSEGKEIRSVASVADASPDDITFLSNPRYASAVAATNAGAVLVGEDWSGVTRAAVVRVKNPDAAFAQVVAWFARPEPAAPVGVHPTAIVAEDVVLGRDVSVGPFCVLEPGVKVGDRTSLGAAVYLGHGVAVGSDGRLYPHVSVREYCRIGDRAILHNGAVIGSEGFGYVPEDGHWKKIPQTGSVVIGDDVEIGANTTVDRARFGTTRIGNGVKIDNLVQVAHNVVIGDDTAIAAQAGISGSARIGARVQLGGQVGVAGHLEIGNDSVVQAQSGVSKSLPPGSIVFGCPALPRGEAAKTQAHVKRLPELKQKVADIEQRLKAMEGRER